MPRLDGKPDASFSDDPKLVARLVRRDAAALRSIYERHSSRVMAMALRILHQRAEAEEVVQDTFVEAWRRAPEFESQRGTVATWLVTIARSRAIDRLRSRNVRLRTATQASGEPIAPSRTPIEDVEQRLARDRIAEALATLPNEQRAALEQAYFEGLSKREIAERSGEPLGTIKTRIRLAMQKLSGLLGRTQ